MEASREDWTCPRSSWARGRIAVVALAMISASLSLGKSVQAAPTLCQETVVPMSDGVRLYGTVMRTGDAPERPRPIIFALSPYGISGGDTATSPPTNSDPCANLNDKALSVFIDPSRRDQYTVVLFHMRGSGASEGRWDTLGPRTQADVHELLDWAARQPWSDRRILLTGQSGVSLYEVYGMDHPAVKAAVVHSSCIEIYRGCSRAGGGLTAVPNVFMALVKESYATSMQTRMRLGLDANPTPAEQLAALGQAQTDLATHDLFDDWQQARSSRRLLPQVKIPVLYSTDLYDILRTSLYDGYLLTPGARLALTGGHTAPTALGSVGVLATHRFIDHYMLGIDNGAESEPRVSIATNLGSRAGYAAGNVVLRGESDWPLPTTRWERLFLGAGPTGSAQSLNDGGLVGEGPLGAEGTDSTVAAPAPGPKSDLRVGSWAFAKQIENRVDGVDLISGYSDLRSDEATGLTYTTPPLHQNLEITGPLVLRLFASSTASNFDWAVRLTDVAPDGSSNWVGEGWLRASLRRVDGERSLRNGAGEIVYPYYPFDRQEAVPAGQIVEYQIAVDPTSNVYQAGHRLRLDIIGTGAAALDAATEPGAGPGVVTIYRDPDHPSSLLVPVIPGRCQDSVPLLSTTPTLDPCAGSLQDALG